MENGKNESLIDYDYESRVCKLEEGFDVGFILTSVFHEIKNVDTKIGQDRKDGGKWVKSHRILNLYQEHIIF